MTTQKPEPLATNSPKTTETKDSNLQVENPVSAAGWRRHTVLFVVIGLGLIAIAVISLLLLNRDSLPFKLPSGGAKSDYLLVGSANQDGENNLYLLRLGGKLEQATLLAEKTTLTAGSFSIQNRQESQPLTGLVYPYGGFIPGTNKLLYWFNQAGKLYLNQFSIDQTVPINLFTGETPYIWGTLLANHTDLFLVETPSANQVRCYLSQNGEPARQLLEGETCVLTGNQTNAYANRMEGDKFTLRTADLSDYAVYTPLEGQVNVGLFSVSPDGTRIAYEKVGPPSQVLLVNTTNGKEITSTGPFNDVVELNFAQNADIAYFIDENEDGELELHLLDDQGARFITSSQTLGALLSQDGKSLVYRAGAVGGEQALFVRNISNGKDVEILRGYNLGYTIIDSLKRILISDSSTEFTFYSSNLDGVDLRALYNQPEISLDKIQTMAGEPYIFTFLNNADGLVSVYTYNLNNANGLILADEMENFSLLDISPDGKEVLFTGRQIGGETAALYLSPLEKAAVPQVLDDTARSISNAVFTYDGDRVVYTAVTGDSSDEVEIRLVNLISEKQLEVIYSAAFLVSTQWKNIDAFQTLYMSGGKASTSICPGAEILSLGQTVHSSLSAGNPDCFRIKASAGEAATFSAQPDDRQELSLALYDRKGDSIESEKSWQTGNNPNLEVTFPADGIYFLQVSSLDGSGGPYSLLSSAGVDICLGAVEIRPGDKLNGKAPANGSAIYRFEGQADQSYTFWLQETAITTGISFYNSEGDAIERSPNQGVYNIFSPSKGNYCLSVSGVGSGNETFTIGMLEGWVYCPSAPELSLDAPVSGKISRETQSCYSFKAEADTQYSLSVNSPDDTDTTIELYDSQGNLLASDDDSGRGYNPFLSFNFNQSGTYYAMVNGMFPDATGNFELTLEGISACSNPQALEVGKTIHANLQEGGKDCYSFEAISGEGLDFYVESDILMVLTLYDQTGQEIASVGRTGDNFTPHLVTTIPADGTYFFTIIILGKTGSGEYSLRMESLRASESCIQDAQQVAIGNVIDGSITPDAQSCYSLVGSLGERVLLWVEAEIDTQLVLYLPNGIELTRDDDSGGNTNPRLVTTLPEEGIYTIAVEGYGLISGAFTLHIEASIPGTDAFDNAVELAWDTRTNGAITSGSYIYLDEFQYGTHGVMYTFLGVEGDKIQVDVLAGSINSLLDPVFYLFNAEHVSLTTDDDSGTGHDSRIIYTLPYTGQYFILVEDIHDRYGDPSSYYFEILLSH